MKAPVRHAAPPPPIKGHAPPPPPPIMGRQVKDTTTTPYTPEVNGGYQLIGTLNQLEDSYNQQEVSTTNIDQSK